MRIYLVRHGRTASNVAGLLDTAFPGAPLDDVGLGQAEALVARLEGHDLEAVYTSDIVRAVQTGTPLATARGLALTALAGLREIPAGDLELFSVWDEYIGVLRAWGEGRLHERRPGGEDSHSFFGRFDAAVASVADAGHSSAVIVSHGAALRTWLGARVHGLTHLEVARRHLGNTAIVALEGDPDGWRLLSWDAGSFRDAPQGVPNASAE